MEKNKINHIGVILDGNRRYAKSANLPSFQGHEKGAEKLTQFLKWCREEKIREVTIYALSTENLNRSREELSALFSLFQRFFKKFKKSKEIHENKIRIKFIGNLSLIPSEIKKLAEDIEEETKNYNDYLINFCFAYGGRDELVYSFNKLLKENRKIVTEQDITNSLMLKNSPDLIIRTGGKTRTSNFLIWQSIYSEWFFLSKMWPEIEKQDLQECIAKYKNIERNFGK
jgi:undecaprenyl diphosphate synthase